MRTSCINIDNTVANAIDDDDDDDEKAAPNAKPSVKLCKLSAIMFKRPTVDNFLNVEKKYDDDDDDDGAVFDATDDAVVVDDDDDDDAMRFGLRPRPRFDGEDDGLFIIIYRDTAVFQYVCIQ